MAEEEAKKQPRTEQERHTTEHDKEGTQQLRHTHTHKEQGKKGSKRDAEIT